MADDELGHSLCWLYRHPGRHLLTATCAASQGARTSPPGSFLEEKTRQAGKRESVTVFSFWFRSEDNLRCQGVRFRGMCCARLRTSERGREAKMTLLFFL